MSERLTARRGLSLERLENFCRVAEAGGITKAAGGDPVRQSLFSRQIRELEEFFGTELIQRDGRGIRLTTAGKRLARLAREQFAALGDFQRETRAAPVTLSIGAGNSVLEWLVTPRLRELRRRLPACEISLLNKRTHDIVRDLVDLKLDIGIVRDNAVERGLKTAEFCRLEYGLFVPAAMANRSLDQLPLVLTADGTFQQLFNEAMRRHKQSFHVAVWCSSFTQAAELLASGEFAAVLPVAAAKRLAKQTVRQVALPGLERCARRLVLAWNPRLAAVRAVLDAAVDALRAAR